MQDLSRAIKHDPKLVAIVHKDEFCEFDLQYLPSDLVYHGYWDPTVIDNQKVFYYPLGVKSSFPRIFPQEIIPLLKRLTFFFSLHLMAIAD